MEKIQGKTDLLSLLPEEVTAVLRELGEPAFRGKQVYEWLQKGASFSEMTNLSLPLRKKLEETCISVLPIPVEKYVSKIDGTVKYLFCLYDGECVEGVLMKYHHGNTLCISSQVGCRMGCAFCASTIGGRVRNLLPGELLGEVIAAEKDSGERVSNIVMMGIGEPLDNYDNVLRFLHLVNCPAGLNIGYRHISLSTCGVVPGILRLAEEALPITLSISLHAPTDEKRSAIMPINRKYPLSELLSACRSYYETTGRRISFEYTLIRGENDTEETAGTLARVLKNAFKGTDAPLHVNLIRINTVRERNFTRGSEASVKAFAAVLEKAGITATVRRRLGADVNAACGQLRRNRREAEEKTPFSHDFENNS